jgi:predicted site-specific integrase-resolvase
MNELLVGYARVSTEQQDLTAQRNGLHALGVGDDRVYVDHGLTGTNRDRPGLRLALAACRAGDTLVVTKLDRLARSLPDARDILDELTKCNVKLSLGGSIHDPTDPVGRLLFNVLAMVAEFESDLIRLRTREGMKVAKAKGRLRESNRSSSRTRPSTCWSCTTLGTTPKLSSPNSSGSDDPPCTGPSSGCGPGHQNRSGHSHISRILTGAMRMLLRDRADGRSILAGSSLPATVDSPSRLRQVLDHVAARQRRSALVTSQLWTLKGTGMGRFASR